MFHINNGDDIVHDGYVPSGINLGGGDYFEIEICMECGTVQGTWPVSHSEIIEAVG